MIPAGTAVLYAPRAGLPLYGRALAGDCPRGLLRVRLTADHERAPKGAALYVLRSRVRLRRPGRHASGVRVWGPAWLRLRGRKKVKDR